MLCARFPAAAGGHFAVLLGLYLLVVQALPVFGAVLQVPSQYSTLQDAVNAAVDGDVITVGPGNYDERVRISGKRLRIVGTRPLSPPAVTSFTISGGADVTMTSLRLGGTEPPFPSQVIRASRASVRLESCVAESLVQIQDAAVCEIVNSVFPGNDTSEALRCERVDVLVIRNSTFWGGQGYKGQCSGSIMALPQEGKAALVLIDCPDVRMAQSVLSGGAGGLLSQGVCDFDLPVEAAGGPAVRVTRSRVVVSVVALQPGKGKPDGPRVVMDPGSVWLDTATSAHATGWVLY